MLVLAASHYHRLVFSAAQVGKRQNGWWWVPRHRTGWRVVPHCSTNDGQAALQLFSRTETELLQAPSNPPAAQGRGRAKWEQRAERSFQGGGEAGKAGWRRAPGSRRSLPGGGAPHCRLLEAPGPQQLPHHLRAGQQAVSGLYNNDKRNDNS